MRKSRWRLNVQKVQKHFRQLFVFRLNKPGFLYFDLSKGSVLTRAIVTDKPRAYTELQFVKYLDQN